MILLLFMVLQPKSSRGLFFLLTCMTMALITVQRYLFRFHSFFTLPANCCINFSYPCNLKDYCGMPVTHFFPVICQNYGKFFLQIHLAVAPKFTDHIQCTSSPSNCCTWRGISIAFMDTSMIF